MSHLKPWIELCEGTLTIEELAAKTNTQTSLVERRITQYGLKGLKKIVKVLIAIEQNKMTRDQACAALEMQERGVNQLMRRWNIMRPMGPRRISREAFDVRVKIRAKFACDMISGSLTAEDAAAFCEVTPRDMLHWQSKLLKKHFQMNGYGLRGLSTYQRSQLAREVERAEDINYDTNELVLQVVRGEKTLHQIGVERAEFDRLKKKRLL